MASAWVGVASVVRAQHALHGWYGNEEQKTCRGLAAGGATHARALTHPRQNPVTIRAGGSRTSIRLGGRVSPGEPATLRFEGRPAVTVALTRHFGVA